MKQLMVLSHDTYASGLTPASSDLDNLASLAVGAWAMINMTPGEATYNQVVDIAATSEADTPAKFMIVTMTSNGLKKSGIITKANATMTHNDYVAPVAKVMTLNNSITNIEVGQVFGFIVTDLTKPAHDLTRNRSYSYTAVAGATEAIINAALIALVNADTLRVVTASSATDIVLTAVTAGENFQVSLMGSLFGQSTITQTTANVVGLGTAAQLVEYEKECKAFRGVHNFPQYQSLYHTEVSEVNTTTPGTYDLWMLKYIVPNQRPVINSEENVKRELLIASLVSLSDSGDGKTVEGLTNLDADLGVE